MHGSVSKSALAATCAAACAAACLAAPARADPLQDQLVAGARAVRADGLAFRRTLAIDRTGAARKLIVERFDPRRAAADRWALLSVDGRAPTPKELADARKAKRGPVPSYAELAKWIGAPATRTNGAPGYVVYRFARLPAGTVKIGSHDASADVQAEALVNLGGRTPFVERVRLTSTKGFRMMLVASLKTMAVVSRYRLLPDGHPAPADAASDMTGSILGKAGRLQTNATYADVVAVR